MFQRNWKKLSYNVSIIDEEDLIMIIVMNVFVAVLFVFLAPIENEKCLNIDINKIILNA